MRRCHPAAQVRLPPDRPVGRDCPPPGVAEHRVERPRDHGLRCRAVRRRQHPPPGIEALALGLAEHGHIGKRLRVDGLTVHQQMFEAGHGLRAVVLVHIRRLLRSASAPRPQASRCSGSDKGCRGIILRDLEILLLKSAHRET